MATLIEMNRMDRNIFLLKEARCSQISMFIFFSVLFIFSKNKNHNGLLKFSVLCSKLHCGLLKRLQGKETVH